MSDLVNIVALDCKGTNSDREEVLEKKERIVVKAYGSGRTEVLCRYYQSDGECGAEDFDTEDCIYTSD
jgi:hypothetical protein